MSGVQWLNPNQAYSEVPLVSLELIKGTSPNIPDW